MPLAQFLLADGTFVLVESADVGSQKPLTGGFTGDVIQTAKVTFEDALERIKPAASVVIDKLRNMADPQDEIEVEFELTLTAGDRRTSCRSRGSKELKPPQFDIEIFNRVFDLRSPAPAKLSSKRTISRPAFP